jgi:hypothetical protein
MNDRTKLPIWAQRLITKLEADIEFHKARGEAAHGQQTTNISLDYPVPFANEEPTRFLKEDESVYFRWGTIWLQVRYNKERGLDVHSNSNSLVVQPRSSNSVSILPTSDLIEVES